MIRLSSRVVQPPASGVPARDCFIRLHVRRTLKQHTHWLEPNRDLEEEIVVSSAVGDGHVCLSYLSHQYQDCGIALSSTEIYKSTTQMHHLKYTGLLPMRFLILRMMAGTPRSSMSSVEITWNPTSASFSRSDNPWASQSIQVAFI